MKTENTDRKVIKIRSTNTNVLVLLPLPPSPLLHQRERDDLIPSFFTDLKKGVITTSKNAVARDANIRVAGLR